MTQHQLNLLALVSIVAPALIIVVVINFAVRKAQWCSLTFDAPPVRILGRVILLAATVFTIWARLVLGVMWSGAPAVKQDHQLRTNGPYSVTRHPIYTGMLGMFLGSLPQLVPGLKLISRRRMAIG